MSANKSADVVDLTERLEQRGESVRETALHRRSHVYPIGTIVQLTRREEHDRSRFMVHGEFFVVFHDWDVNGEPLYTVCDVSLKEYLDIREAGKQSIRDQGLSDEEVEQFMGPCTRMDQYINLKTMSTIMIEAIEEHELWLVAEPEE